jgi:hypothetical protein
MVRCMGRLSEPNLKSRKHGKKASAYHGCTQRSTLQPIWDREPRHFGIDVDSNQPKQRRLTMPRCHFVMMCFVGVTAGGGAAGEMTKVTQAFQPSGRFSAANSL